MLPDAKESMKPIRKELSTVSAVEIVSDPGESIMRIQSDSFREIPATSSVPEEVHIVLTGENTFSVRPVNSGGERFEISADEAVRHIKENLLS